MTDGADSEPPFDIAPFVHPELRQMLPLLLPVTETPLKVEMLPVMRATGLPFLPEPAPEPAWTWRTIPGSPEVRVIVIDPDPAGTAPRPAIVHCHGGGFMVGSATTSLIGTQAMARELGVLVVSVEYRLAPEHHFPAALDDNYAALAWVHAAADELRVDVTRIAVAGESAGGGHAAMLALAARDRGEFAIAAQALVYPMLDDRTGSVVRTPPHVGTIIWNEQRNRLGWTSLLGVTAGADAVPAGAVPARVADLSELPPTWIGVGGLDLFVDEDIDYARRLIAAGVAVRLNVVPGAYHVFDVFDAPVSRAFRADLVAWLRATLV